MCSYRSTGSCQCVAQQCTREKFGEDTRISQVLVSELWGHGEGKAGWPDRTHSQLLHGQVSTPISPGQDCDTGTDTEVTTLYSRFSSH